MLVLAAVAGFASGASFRMPVAAAATGCIVAAVTVAAQLSGTEYHWLDDAIFFGALVGGPAAAGTLIVENARQVRRLDALVERLRAQQTAEVEAARLNEQIRVGHEVYSGLAERIGAVATLAEGARRTRQGADVLMLLETEAREVLDQLRAALGELRSAKTRHVELPGLPESGRTVPRPSGVDLTLAVSLAAALAVETLLVEQARGPAWANVLAALLVPLPLVPRRSRPLLGVAASLVLAVMMSIWLTPVSTTVTGVAYLLLISYTVGAWSPGRWWVAGGAMILAGSLALGLIAPGGGEAPWIAALWTGAAVAVGRLAALWHRRVQRSSAVLAALEREPDARVGLAVAEERAALASRLHDTVAHAMTVVCLHAGAGRRGGADPDEALQVIVATASASLAELRDGLDDMDSQTSPLDPGRVAALARRMGIDVDVAWSHPGPSGPGALLGFRVVREAMVNASRHAPGATMTVRLGGSPGTILLEVTDDGGGPGGFRDGSGTGLSGLGEALAAVGGRLEWGRRVEGGFRVAATIPEAAA